MSEQGWIFSVGILIAVISYFTKNFIFEPLIEFRRVKGKIQNRLKYYANIITNGEFPPEVVKPIREELRQLSCDLEEQYCAIGFSGGIYWLLQIPNKQTLSDIARDLIFLSNSTGHARHIDNNDAAIENIKRKLKII